MGCWRRIVGWTRQNAVYGSVGRRDGKTSALRFLLAYIIDADRMGNDRLRCEFSQQVAAEMTEGGVEIRQWKLPLVGRLGALAGMVVVSILLLSVSISLVDALSFLAVFTFPFSLLIWFVGQRPHVRLETDKLVVRNPFTSHRIPYEQIVATADGWAGPILRLDNHHAVRVWAVQKSNFATLFKIRTSADELVQELELRCPNLQR